MMGRIWRMGHSLLTPALENASDIYGGQNNFHGLLGQ